ncbi:TetR/AcrR family transcriptional regulator [Pendulispora brunnea]|uniref:TetR/AcrR family transcriptional regulator n=1 Tax=Pendulispora brunnea TaxID=2905690 RepID=A0ABZ2JUV6_9BACT
MARVARPYHHGDLRNALLAEAAKVVETDGVAALTLRELARRLGVSHAAPTNHFPDKDALLAELAAQGFDELARDLEAGAHGRSPEVRLRELGRAYVRFALRRPGHYRVMFGRGFAKESRTRLAEAGDRAFSTLQQAVTAAMPPTRARSAQRVREACFLACSVVHGAAMLLLDGPLAPHLSISPDDEAAVSELIDQATASVSTAIREGR